MSMAVKLLDASQTNSFDTEYVNDSLFISFSRAIEENFDGSKKIRMIDVGGGNGKFSDKVLHNHPQVEVTIVEPDKTLFEKNTPHPNKHLAATTFQDFSGDGNLFDIIEFNWVLHHFVGQSHENTLQLQLDGLMKCKELLKPDGIIVIYENFYDGFFGDDIPGEIIYRLTASSALKGLTERMGANTAGVGVRFHSEQGWIDMIEAAGCRVSSSEHCYDFGNLSVMKRVALGIAKQRVGMIVGKLQH